MNELSVEVEDRLCDLLVGDSSPASLYRLARMVSENKDVNAVTSRVFGASSQRVPFEAANANSGFFFLNHRKDKTPGATGTWILSKPDEMVPIPASMADLYSAIKAGDGRFSLDIAAIERAALRKLGCPGGLETTIIRCMVKEENRYGGYGRADVGFFGEFMDTISKMPSHAKKNSRIRLELIPQLLTRVVMITQDGEVLAASQFVFIEADLGSVGSLISGTTAVIGVLKFDEFENIVDIVNL